MDSNGNNINFNAHSDPDGNPFKDLARWLTSLPPIEYSVLGSIIGTLMAFGLTIPEQNSLGNWLEQIGQILLTISAQAQVINPSNYTTPSPDTDEKIKDLQQEIQKIYDYISNYLKRDKKFDH